MRVIFVGGPRGSGKSTLIRRALSEFPGEVHAFHHIALQRAAANAKLPVREYLKRNVPAGKTIIIEGKFAPVASPTPMKRWAKKQHKSHDFEDGLVHYPFASRVVLLTAPATKLDERIALDLATEKKKRLINPHARLAEWIAARYAPRRIVHIDSENMESAYARFRRLVAGKR